MLLVHKRQISVALVALLANFTFFELGSAAEVAVPNEILRYATEGCNGAVLLAPPPGKQFAAPSVLRAGKVEGFYEKAARLNAVWTTSLKCTSTGLSHKLSPITATAQTTASHAARITPTANTSSNNNGLVSNNWSGYQISDSAQYTQAGWTLPTVVKPSPVYASNYFSSHWTGIGGGYSSGSGALVQAGTSAHLYGNTPDYYFWYEIVGGVGDTSSEQTFGPSLSPGDSVGAGATYTPPVPPATTGTTTLGVCNFSLSPATCSNLSLSTSAPGNSTEWIVEAPSSGGIPLAIADYGSLTFGNICWTSSYSGSGPPSSCSSVTDGTSVQSIDLVQYYFGMNQYVSIAGSLSTDGTSFPVNYQNPDH
jgi:hypothetical protein